MKKNILSLIFFIIIIFSGFILGTKYSEPLTYQFNVRNLNAINADQVSDIFLNNKSGIIYIGRPTCPHCFNFVPLLRKAVSNSGASVYHFNTDLNREHNNFEKAIKKLEVQTVPTLVFIENGTIKKQLNGSNLSLEELESLLNKS